MLTFGIRVCNYPFGLVMDQALREKWTRDPFDRIIVAHARARKAPLITSDRNILRHYDLAIVVNTQYSSGAVQA